MAELSDLQKAHHRKCEGVGRTLKREWVARGNSIPGVKEQAETMADTFLNSTDKPHRRKILRNHRKMALAHLRTNPAQVLPAPKPLDPAGLAPSHGHYIDALAATLAAAKISPTALAERHFLADSVEDARYVQTYDERIEVQVKRLAKASQRYVSKRIDLYVHDPRQVKETMESLPAIIFQNLDTLLLSVGTTPTTKRTFVSKEALLIYISWLAIRDSRSDVVAGEIATDIEFEPKAEKITEEQLHDLIRGDHGEWVTHQYPGHLMDWLNQRVEDPFRKGIRKVPRWRTFTDIAPLVDPTQGLEATRKIADAIALVWNGKSHTEVAEFYNVKSKYLTAVVKIGHLHAGSDHGIRMFNQNCPALGDGVFEELLAHRFRIGAGRHQTHIELHGSR